MMHPYWRSVALFAWADAVCLGMNGYLAWANRGASSWTLLINCVGITITLWSIKGTVQHARAVIQVRRLEKLLDAVERSNKRSNERE